MGEEFRNKLSGVCSCLLKEHEQGMLLIGRSVLYHFRTSLRLYADYLHLSLGLVWPGHTAQVQSLSTGLLLTTL